MIDNTVEDNEATQLKDAQRRQRIDGAMQGHCRGRVAAC